MGKREKIEQMYSKHGITVGEDLMEEILNNRKRVADFMRVYKNGEMDSMNDIFGKDYNNKVFTKEELEFGSKFDLFDREVIKVAKIIWKHRKDSKALKQMLSIFKRNGTEEFNSIIKEREVVARCQT